MIETKKAAFLLASYKITQFSFEEPKTDTESIDVKFEPSGDYFQKEGKFILTFAFRATHSEPEELITQATLQATFTFPDPPEFNNIPEYFYRNSIAIVFPYLRSFVSALTVLGSVKPVILPIMNLSSLEKPLRSNTNQHP